MSTLREEYNKSVAPALMTKFNYKSVMQIPKLPTSNCVPASRSV